MNKTRIVFGIGIVLTALALFTAPAMGYGWEAHFVPENSTGGYGGSDVLVYINFTESVSETVCGQTDIYYDKNCLNIVTIDQSMSPFSWNDHNWFNDSYHGSFFMPELSPTKTCVHVQYDNPAGGIPAGDYTLAVLTLHCNCSSGCSSDLLHGYVEVNNEMGDPITGGFKYYNGTYTCTGAPAAPDLIVSEIKPNCDYLFGNESNEICAKIENVGGEDAGSFNVSFSIGGFSEEIRISGLTAGENTTVCVTDTTERNADAPVTITVTADCNAEVDESDETNNASALATTVVNNGYKGKRYTGGEDIKTLKTYDLNGNLVYSVGDSYYLSSYTHYDWTTYDVSWTASELPVPAGATVVEARLFVPYTWDKSAAENITDYFSMNFNNVVQTKDAHYSDRKSYDGWDKPYGMLAYDVTADFDTSGNVANLTNSYPGGDSVSMRGMLLVVVYADDSERQRTIIMNEEFDLLYGGAGKCTTPEEATAYAPFGAIDPCGVEKATLITVAPGAGKHYNGKNPVEGELIFNGHVWYNAWDFAGVGDDASTETEIGIREVDVKPYLQSTGNLVGFQSSGDYMEASNAFLIVEKPIPADVTIEPETLNLKSNGEWITAYIELPECYDVEDIDVNTVLLDCEIPAENDTQYGFVINNESYLMDHDGDGIMERMVKFNRTAVIEYLEEIDYAGDTGKHKLVELSVTGKVAGTSFKGSDTITVIM